MDHYIILFPIYVASGNMEHPQAVSCEAGLSSTVGSSYHVFLQIQELQF